MILIYMWCVIYWFNGFIINFNVVRVNVMIFFFIFGNDWLDWYNVRYDKWCNIMII